MSAHDERSSATSWLLQCLPARLSAAVLSKSVSH